tara:strand:+ start:553 stop:759 length:207 start_codon:yes stop_codon:yes gene_type:complete
MKNIGHLCLSYQGRIITSVIEGQDAQRAQICPGFVQINVRGSCGTDNACGIQIPLSQWHYIQRKGSID